MAPMQTGAFAPDRLWTLLMAILLNFMPVMGARHSGEPSEMKSYLRFHDDGQF